MSFLCGRIELKILIPLVPSSKLLPALVKYEPTSIMKNSSKSKSALFQSIHGPEMKLSD